MKPQQQFTFQLTQEQLQYIKPLIPMTFSLVPVVNSVQQKQVFIEKHQQNSSVGKRQRKCPKDPYYQTDYQFYKNKKTHHEPETHRHTQLSSKEINSCKNVMENLKQRLSSQQIEVRIKLGCCMENILNKLKESSFSSTNQFSNQIKTMWKNILSSYEKQDIIYQVAIEMQVYSKQLINSTIKKRVVKPIQIQKPIQSKRLSPQSMYLNSAKNTKRKCPPNFMIEQAAALNKKTKKSNILSKQTVEFQNQEPKIATNYQTPNSIRSNDIQQNV